MVLGANIGSAINPVLEGTGGDPVKLRLPLGNLATRLVGAAIALPFLGADRRLADRARAGAGPARGEFPHRASISRWPRSSSASCRRSRSCWCASSRRRPVADDPGQAALSRSGGAADAGRGARQRGARGASHGRRRGKDARRHAGDVPRRRPPSARRDAAAWTTSSTACTRRCSATSPRSRMRG